MQEPEPAGPAGDLTERFGARLRERAWLLSSTYNAHMPTKAEFYVWYKPERRWQVGVAYLVEPQAPRYLVNYELTAQRRERPALSTGIGLTQVGTGRVGAFLTAGWTLTPWLNVPSSGYVGVARQFPSRRPLTGRWLPVLGASVQFVERPNLMATVQMDGRRWHGVLSVKVGDVRLGALALGFRNLGVIVGWQGF
jgi:hypothetical protein